MKPLKMDLTEGSETSDNINQTPGNHPKVDTLNTEHGESLKSRAIILITFPTKFTNCDYKIYICFIMSSARHSVAVINIFSKIFRPSLGHTQTPNQRVSGGFYSGAKWLGLIGNHSAPYSATARKEWSYIPAPPACPCHTFYQFLPTMLVITARYPHQLQT
jgi:hypothetical protein